MKLTAIVRWTRTGFHLWKGATENRKYLGMPHRHKFYFEVEIETFHNDREIEFHDLLDVAENATPPNNASWGGCSCEMMAQDIAKTIRRKYSVMRWLRVSVFEDNEVGASFILAAGEDV